MLQDSNESLQKLATGIREELEITSILIGARILLSWLPMYICQEAIEQVLSGASQVLRELDLPFVSLLRIPPEELAPCWRKHIQAFSNESKRAQPHIIELQYTTIRDVATCVYSAIKQRTRNSQFLQSGPPPGITDFPVLSSLGSKTVPVSWALVGNPRVSQDDEFKKFMSHVVARRRPPAARTATRDLPQDTSAPFLYT